MIDLKIEAAKFKPIKIEEPNPDNNENNSQSALDENTKNAIGCYNKSLEQIQSNLDDMARGNLKRAIQLRPDFPQAISLLAAVNLSKGDRNGVLKLLTNTDGNIKKLIQPYIDYLFREYDKVEYSKEKKTDDLFSEATKTAPVVYINNEGRKQPRPFDSNYRPVKNEEKKTEKKALDFKYSDPFEKKYRSQETQTETPKFDGIDKVKTNDPDVDILMGGRSSGLYNEKKPEKQKEEKPVKRNVVTGSKYTKQEIKRNRIIAIAILVAFLLFILMFITIIDQRRQIKHLKASKKSQAPVASVSYMNEN